jgi:uracil-DNA glycosylase
LKVINNSEWKPFFTAEEQKPYFAPLMQFVEAEYSSGVCYPPKDNIFSAFELLSPKDIKVVILGQDPYHQPNQAHGLCFSVLPSQPKLPPSLKNIYKELTEEYGTLNRQNGFLEDWARQGVLMLNTVMTVREGEANSHKDKGWESFTDNVLAYVNTLEQPVVYLLWGAPAQKKARLVTNPKQLVLTAAHPSPLSAYRGFFGCGHFKACNDFLSKNGVKEIEWN